MYSIFRFICISFLFCFSFSIGYAEESKQNLLHELQVLIDVSGSMKQNDPDNLRIPAVKLLVNLLPQGTKAGLWLFAEKTSILVETGIVNAQWKKKALAKINKIHSRGLFTNIEDAIQLSSQEWTESTSGQKRNLILLTDGMVDVSKDVMQSAESRERILVEQIPLLQKAGVKVQTIALSDNADKQLLEKLAFDTNGWSETTQTAEQLQRVFFKMFKKAIPQDTVPIKGNGFNIDSAIKEFSLLIFKRKISSTSQLTSPEKKTINEASHPKNIAWIEEKNYDLVTVKNPKPGVWKIDAQMDPDNQVMIVTDLKFKVDEIVNHISAKESFELTGYFTDKKQLISREDFLKLIKITIELVDEQGKKDQWIMQSDEDKAGLFVHKMHPLKKGKYSIKIVADGKTFKRENTQTISVLEGVVGVETEINKVDRTMTLKIIPDEAIIDSQMMSVQVTIDQPGNSSETHTLEKKDGNWEIVVNAPEAGKNKTINFSIMAKTKNGDSVSPNIKPIIVSNGLFAAVEIVEEKKQLKTVDDKDKEEEDEKAEEIIEQPVEEVDWMNTSIIVIVVNIFLIAGCFFTFRFLKKRAAVKQTQLLDRLT